MTVFLLHEDLEFPHPELSEPDGLLAVGGDLSIERLLIAYKSGYSHGISQVRYFGGHLL